MDKHDVTQLPPNLEEGSSLKPTFHLFLLGWETKA